MKYLSSSYRQIIRAALIIAISIAGTAWLNPLFAQTPSISGPTCVVAGVAYNYQISYYYSGSANYNYSISGGTLSTGGTGGTHIGPGVANITVTWTGNGTIFVTTTRGPVSQAISLTTALSGGTITSGTPQTINYNVTPAGIVCGAASGGGCPTPSYSYQWQSSTDNVNFSNVTPSQTGQNISFTTGLTQTTYFRRLVTETSSGGTANSGTATINVYPQLNPGNITPLTITVAPGNSPGLLTGSMPTGGAGAGSYSYQWKASGDGGTTWSTVATTQSYTPPGLSTTTLYYRNVTSNGVTLPTPTATVSVVGGVPNATNSTGSPNTNYNWVISTGYDFSGNIMAQGKGFFDNSGRPLQNQSKVFYRKNATTVYTHVFASEPIRDAYGREVLNTLSAPIDYADFNYMPGFVQATDGSNYTYKNFDRFNPSGTETDLTNSPQFVGGQSTRGTLGWYYSANNNWEPYTPTTNFPYTRETFYGDGTTNVKKQAGSGEAFVMGSGHETSSFGSPAVGEFAHYIAVRNQYFTSAQMGSLPPTLANNAIVTVARDPNGNQLFSLSDKDGNVLMVARPGSDKTLNSASVIAAPNPAVYSAIIEGTDNITVTPSSATIQVYTGSTLFYSGPASGFTVSSLGSQSGNVICQQPFAYQNCPGSGCSPAASAAPAPSIQYFNILLDATPVTIAGGGYTLYDMNSETPTGLIGGNSLNHGYYKLVANSGIVTLSYSSSFTDVSYNFYNQLGQLVASIAPEGVKKLYSNTYPSLAAIPFITLYTYDTRGNLVGSTTPDEGASQYIYRQDGQLRFSQNALQAANGTYNYINYDQLGRAVESGQYQPTDGITFNSAPMSGIIENTTSTGGFVSGTKTDVVMTTYDLPDNSHGQTGYVQDPAYLGGAVSTSKRYSSIVNNTPLATYLISQSWFNYDEEGKVIWAIRYIASLGPTVGYKTIDYSYDQLSRLFKKVFQKNTTAETFVHYLQYDPANGNLWKVYTATADIGMNNATLQANYIYYLHGGVKRVELATNVQGIDYTYTLQGGLKAINNSNANADPGGDAPANNGFSLDAFGEVLDYHPNDYTNNRTTGLQPLVGVNTSSLVPTESYAGNIKAMSWYSLAAIVGGTSNPKAYIYNYDPKYQFIASTWGTIPNFNSNPAPFTASTINQETITVPGTSTPAYDGNGNILNLQRTDNGGAALDAFIYHYDNNNNQLTSVANGPSGSTNYATYTYDALGRETSENTGTASSTKYIKYDSRGKVVLVTTDALFQNPMVSYVYDEAGHKIEKLDYDGTSHLVNQVTYYYGDVIYTQLVTGGTNYGTLTAWEYQVQGATGRVGIYKKPSASYVYQLTDHLGSIRAVVNSSGVVQIANDYYPFGKVILPANGQYRYGYQGLNSEADLETGWNNFELRMYNPEIARWFSTDPVGQYWSPYEGMGNNPVSSTDNDGGSSKDYFKNSVGEILWDPSHAASISWNGENWANIGAGYTEFDGITAVQDWWQDADGPHHTTRLIPLPTYEDHISNANFVPTFWQRWESGNLGQKVVYGVANSFWVTAQNLGINQLKGRNFAIGLNGSATTPNENVMAFAGAGTFFIPGAGEADAFASTGTTIEKNVFSHPFEYAARIRERALEDPVSHNFPYSFDDEILSTTPIPKNNGYNMFQLDGTMNGKNGVFEIGLTNDGIINHRFFRPY